MMPRGPVVTGGGGGGRSTPAATIDRTFGRLPNVYKHALDMDALRLLPAFEALPPASAVALAGPASHR